MKNKKLSKLQLAQHQTETAILRTNQTIDRMGEYSISLNDSLNYIHSLFDSIRNVPSEDRAKAEELKKIRLQWSQQAENIELEYKKAEVKTVGQGTAGVGAGVAVVTLGPSAAMGIATTFGVASTGTAISSLSGAAATNAALAWLGGGALTAGGGGMVAGSAFLALAGPVGWGIAGVSLLASGLMFWKTKSDKERLENIFTLISERDIKSYNLAIVELSERILRIKNETNKLVRACVRIESFGTDYNDMTEEQQYELGAYVNLMESSTTLLTNPILGLSPRYTEQDLDKLCKDDSMLDYADYYYNNKTLIIALANLLYKIDMNDKDRKLLAKSLKSNKEFLSSVDMNKKEFTDEHLIMVDKALSHVYKIREY